ncbi:MAG: HepT-like ribonuclease domain-containing protein [Tepidiformaceae bacterium]
MLDHAERAERLGNGRPADAMRYDDILGAAILRWLELLGESANRVPRSDQDRFPQLPWRDMIGLRNLLIHQYDRLNYTIIERIIADELPPLIVALRAIIEQEYS